MQRWEYAEIGVEVGMVSRNEAPTHGLGGSRLELAGGDGWELVSCVPISSAKGTTGLLYVFKRPVQSSIK
jgi:hypothetical protein